MVVLDTSAIVAISDARDRFHDDARRALELQATQAVIPAGILAEIDHMLTVRVGKHAMGRVLDALLDGSLLLDCGDVDPPRIRELMARYTDLGLGFADAAVIACAERNGGAVMTFDRRDFEVVAAEGRLTLVPSRMS
jgi:predicted nucleic acid-binding protein